MKTSPDKSKRWYEEGIRFECVKCGKCCKNHGEYQYVYLGKADMEAISCHLDLKIDAFFWRHCQTEGGWIFLKPRGDSCRFLGQNGCRIYSVRPKQCSTWPFWEENLGYETWFSKVVPYCEGIGQGRLYAADDVDRLAKERDESCT